MVGREHVVSYDDHRNERATAIARHEIRRLLGPPTTPSARTPRCSCAAIWPSWSTWIGWGFDEFWCGEHHSTGWEIIASPELFLAAAAERTHRIRLGTGVVSLPYHHPFMVAQRLVQLDHQSGGRLIFGSGPGALPSDAHTLGVDPMLLRDRQDEAMGVIRRLFAGGERFSYRCEWFQLNEAKLQLLPLQRDMEFRRGGPW